MTSEANVPHPNVSTPAGGASLATPPKETLPLWLAWTMLIATALFWGGTAVAARAAAGDIPPFTLTFWRWTIAALIFLPIGWRPFMRDIAIYRRHWAMMAGLSFLGVTAFTICYFVGLQYTTGVNGSLLHMTTPVIIVICAVFVLRSRLTTGEAAGTVLAILGAAIIVLKGDLTQLLALSFNVGDLFIIAGMTAWALYTICLRWLPKGLDPSGMILVLAAMSVPMLLPFYLWDLAGGRGFGPSVGNIGLILYTAVFSSVLAYLFWNRGVAVAGPKAAGFSHYLIPVFGTAGSVTLLGEAFEPFHALAVALIVAGLILAASKGDR